jgi:hypothetical protein
MHPFVLRLDWGQRRVDLVPFYTHDRPEGRQVVMPLNKVRAFLDDHHSKVGGDHAFEGLYRAGNCRPGAYSGAGTGQDRQRETRWRTGDGCAAALYQVDLLALQKAVGVDEAVLATGTEFQQNCRTVKRERSLRTKVSREREITFNAGTHVELIRISCADFEMLVKPEVLGFSSRFKMTFDHEAVPVH